MANKYQKYVVTAYMLEEDVEYVCKDVIVVGNCVKMTFDNDDECWLVNIPTTVIPLDENAEVKGRRHNKGEEEEEDD